MGSQNPGNARFYNIPVTYRLMRAVVRLVTRVLSPRLRLINQDKLYRPHPAILVVTHPQSLRVALFLIATLDKPVRCLVPAGQMRGIFLKLLGRALGMQAFESLARKRESLVDSCLGVLARHGTLALFAEPFPQDGCSRSDVADFAAMLALQAILDGQGQVLPTLYAVHWFLGVQRRRQERLAYVEGPIQAHQFLPKVGEDVAEASLHLAETVQKTIGANIFGLAEPELERFRRELEDFSREHLQQQWSGRPDWKQKPDELHLNSIARRWVDEQNRTDPARLIELRQSLDAYREESRRSSMQQLIVDISGPWQASRLRLTAGWVETVLGFPIALYGLINHFPAGIILSTTGFLKSSPKRDPKSEWLMRMFVVLSFYTIQVFLVHFWWGRAIAGYYTLTLPVSGAYLWRYRWLLQHRSHVLALKALQPLGTARLARRQENILESLSSSLERSAQSTVVPYGRSPDPVE